MQSTSSCSAENFEGTPEDEAQPGRRGVVPPLGQRAGPHSAVGAVFPGGELHPPHLSLLS